MGAETSKEDYQEYLVRFTSPETIPADDGFWNEFLNIPIHFIAEDIDGADRNAEFAKLALENANSGNLRLLLDKFRYLVSDVPQTEKSMTEATNAIFILRLFIKEIVDTVDESLIANYFYSSDDQPEAPTGIELLTGTLLTILACPAKDEKSYHLQVECASALITLLAVQMYSTQPASAFFIYQRIMVGLNANKAPFLIKALLENFILETLHDDETGSFVMGLASGIWNMIGGRRRFIQARGDELGDLSVWIILVLANHCTKTPNPYREAIFTFTNSNSTALSNGTETTETGSFDIDLGRLYTAICNTMDREGTVLLLYTLLHRNPNVRTYFLARTDIELVVVPMLKTVYMRGESGSCHVYMCLIILLILSEDSLFSQSVHNITIKNVTWYAERSISETTLGGLMILVIVRTVYLNMRSMRDQYLHTNCLASLANMADHFTNLHPFVCHKIVSLFEVLSKKSIRLANQLQKELEQQGNRPSTPHEDAILEMNGHEEIEMNGDRPASPDCEMKAQNLAVIQEVLHMILEIINACLTRQLQHNPNLVYALLHRRDLFEDFRKDPTFQDVMTNLDVVINYFSARLEMQMEGQTAQLTEDEVVSVIVRGSLQWPAHKLQPLEELKFKYVEDEAADSFFIPSVWAYIKSQTTIPFSSENVKLFKLLPDEPV